jgi:hypothetical protein
MLTTKLDEKEKDIQKFPNEDIGEMFQIAEKWWEKLDPLKQ